MQVNLYESVKDFLIGKLTEKYENQDDKLEPNDIEEEIEKAKKILLSEMKSYIFSDTDSTLSNKDFLQLKIELEKHFDVKMKEGIIIKGEEQQKRDTTWWSNKTKLEQEKTNKNFYWKRLKKFYEKSLPPEVIKTIDEDTDMTMDNIGNPNLKEFDIYGMVVGHVQSGKTGNYSALICKAADAGYKFIVVIAGDKNNLRNQTQERINESFIGKNINKLIGVGLIESKNQKIPISLTTVEKDFNTRDADKNSQGFNFDNSFSTPILLVIKKNTATLTNVISWIKNQNNNKIPNHSMLVIDDESDYASINTKEHEDPTTINKKIRALLGLFHKSSYVAYTATPYANIFIDHQVEETENIYIDKKNKQSDISKDLFPRDFIYALDAPSNYFGARKIFLENSHKHIVTIDDYEDVLPTKHKSDYDLQDLPNSLYEAINVYILNIAIRHLRNQENKHNSMLIHISRFSDVHSQIATLVNRYLENTIKNEIKSFGKLPNPFEQSEYIQILFNIYQNNFSSIEFKWEEILVKLVDIVDTVLVREEHQKSKLRIEYRKDIVSNIIAIGGMSLARGFTLEGLSVSYFIRSTIFYDTLMQMGRWFGYRPEYEDLCKIYMPLEIKKYFAQIIEATEELMVDFKEIAKEDKTPLDFGLAVKQHPDSLLQVTAKNKRKNTKTLPHKMNLNGILKETVRFSRDKSIHEKNFNTLEKFIAKIDDKIHKKDNSIIFKNIDKNEIGSFLNDFITFKRNVIDNLMPIKFIQEYVKKMDTNWDVVLYSGSQQNITLNKVSIKAELRRSFDTYKEYIEIGQRKISSGTPELSIFENDVIKEINNIEFEKGEKTKFIRKKLKNPILMLHVLNVPNFTEKLPGFGVCFPDNGLDNSQTVEYVVNSVYIKALQEQINFEDESDD